MDGICDVGNKIMELFVILSSNCAKIKEQINIILDLESLIWSWVQRGTDFRLGLDNRHLIHDTFTT